MPPQFSAVPLPGQRQDLFVGEMPLPARRALQNLVRPRRCSGISEVRLFRIRRMQAEFDFPHADCRPMLLRHGLSEVEDA